MCYSRLNLIGSIALLPKIPALRQIEAFQPSLPFVRILTFPDSMVTFLSGYGVIQSSDRINGLKSTALQPKNLLSGIHYAVVDVESVSMHPLPPYPF